MREYLREAKIEDAHFIFEVRNDEWSRKNSINKDLIDYNTHIRWYTNKLNDINSHIYILTDGNEDFGHIVLDKQENKDNRVKISYCIAPQYRNKGYGTRLLMLAEKKVKDEMGYVLLHAEVINENIISQKIFVKLNYKKLCNQKDVIIFEKIVQ